MPLALRRSPLRDLLLSGLGLSLVLPIAPARAEPAALPDWGVAAKPAAAPAAAPPAAAPPAAAPPAAAAETDTTDDIEIIESPPASRRSPKPAKPKSKPRSAAAPKAPAAAAAEAPAQQASVGPSAAEQRANLIARRNGHGEVLAGAMLTTAGLASLGVMSGGLYLDRLSGRELARGEGRPEQELAPLRAQQRRAETMIAAGAIAGGAGLALGVALLVIGARDLKTARGDQRAAHLRVAPTLGGLVLAGRF